jgi:uncharacterized delta-60 repeat protein
MRVIPFSQKAGHTIFSRKRPARRARLRLDSLDDRIVPTAGDLDLTFGAGGVVTTPFGQVSDRGRAVAVQADGKIVVAGTASSDFAVLRYNPDGSLDPSFSADGKAFADLGASDTAKALAVQADGKIVVAGWSESPPRGDNTVIALARFLPDGSLDPTFDGDGKLTTNFGTPYAIGSDVALQADGKIVVAGEVRWPDYHNTFGVVRYNPDGSLDTSFDGDGRVTTDFGHGSFANAVALQADDKIVVAGDAGDGSKPDFALARYNPDGSLDPTFDADGMVTTPVGSSLSAAWDVVVQADGRIVAAGSAASATDPYNLGLARYNPDGSLDPSFGAGGTVMTDIAGYGDFFDGIALQGDKVVIAAHGYTGTSWDFAALRYNPDGSLDPTFNGDGKVTTDIAGLETDFAAGLAIQADGKVLVVGYTDRGSGEDRTSDVALVRYVADGFLDPAFDGDGRVVTAVRGADEVANAVALQSDGKIIAAGSGYRSDFTLARYQPDGSLDPTFGQGGKVATAFYLTGTDAAAAVAVQSDGKIVAAGQGFTGADDDFALARYLPDGNLDPSFGTGGKVTTPFGGQDHGRALALLPGGKLLVAGYTNAGGNYDFALARYNPDGSLDLTFDGDGKLTTPFGPGDDFATAVAVQADGKILVSGQSFNGTNNDFALARYNPDGSLDPTFGGEGRVTTDFGTADEVSYGLAVQPDGRIVLSGYAATGPGNTDFALARYLPGGALDATFDGDGRVVAGIAGRGTEVLHSLVLQPDGKIVAAGYADVGGTSDFALARFNLDGSPDATFDSDGRLTVAVGPGDDAGFAAALQPNGRIVAAGSAYNGTDLDFAVIRVRGDNRSPIPIHTELTVAEDTSLSVTEPTYVYDPDGDPVTVDLLFGPAHGTLSLASDGAFTYTPDPDFNGSDGFVYKVSDAFGGSDIGSVEFTVTPVDEPVPHAEVSADPVLTNKQSLFIWGTEFDDTLIVRPLGLSTTAYAVFMNGGPAQIFRGVTGRVHVSGLGGNDTITVKGVRIRSVLDGGAGDDTVTAGTAGDILTGGLGNDALDGGPGVDRLVESGDVDFTLVQGTTTTNGSLTGLGTDVLLRNRIERAELTGGSGSNRIDASAFTGRTWLRGLGGNDTLRGGSLIDVLIGDTGNDDLDGGAGADVLIGGDGIDLLTGGAGADVLIGGTTVHDGNLTALDAIVAEWTSGSSYTLRLKHLQGTLAGGKNGNYRLNATTVFNDALAPDALTGGQGLDWFVVSLGDTLDLMAGEQKLTV